MHELLKNESVQLLIAMPVALLILEKSKTYQSLKNLISQIIQLFVQAFDFVKDSIKDDFSYLEPTPEQQRPLKNSSKTYGWAGLLVFCFWSAFIMIYGLAKLGSLISEEFYIFTIGMLYFLLCLWVSSWFAACAHKLAWQNGVDISLKRTGHGIS